MKNLIVVLDREISNRKQPYIQCLFGTYNIKKKNYIVCFQCIIINLIFINCIFSEIKKKMSVKHILLFYSFQDYPINFQYCNDFEEVKGVYI